MLGVTNPGSNPLVKGPQGLIVTEAVGVPVLEFDRSEFTS